MGYLIDILIGAMSRIVARELSAHSEPLARWIIKRAVECLPVDDRDKFREEWLAHLEETPGALRKFCHAVGCRLGAPKVAGVLAGETKCRAIPEAAAPLSELTDADCLHHLVVYIGVEARRLSTRPSAKSDRAALRRMVWWIRREAGRLQLKEIEHLIPNEQAISLGLGEIENMMVKAEQMIPLTRKPRRL
jgi:hypothetical protein